MGTPDGVCSLWPAAGDRAAARQKNHPRSRRSGPGSAQKNGRLGQPQPDRMSAAPSTMRRRGIGRIFGRWPRHPTKNAVKMPIMAGNAVCSGPRSPGRRRYRAHRLGHHRHARERTGRRPFGGFGRASPVIGAETGRKRAPARTRAPSPGPPLSRTPPTTCPPSRPSSTCPRTNQTVSVWRFPLPWLAVRSRTGSKRPSDPPHDVDYWSA